MLISSRDMANVSVGWEVEGIISAEQSVSCMLQVIGKKTIQDTGTFWTWEGKVSLIFLKKSRSFVLTGTSNILGRAFASKVVPKKRWSTQEWFFRI